ncbi:MAG: hypothetical protein AAF358_03350 [Pseudomonadota bacterium]
MKKLASSTAFCLLLALATLPRMASSGAGNIQLLPPQLYPGAEIILSIFDQPGGIARSLRIRDPGADALFPLGDATTNRAGSASFRADLPDLAPGLYLVEMLTARGGAVIDVAGLEVLEPPQVRVEPDSAFSGESVEVSVTGLPAGQSTVFLDDLAIVGPVTVADGLLERRFIVPAGDAGVLTVRVESQGGNRTLASVETTFRRSQTVNNQIEPLSISLPSERLERNALRALSGELRLPDGMDPESFLWTLVLISQDGTLSPINVRPIEWTPTMGKGDDNIHNYAVEFVLPGLLSGYTQIPIEGSVDGLGLFYQIPQFVGSEPADPNGAAELAQNAYVDIDGNLIVIQEGLPYDDELGITINGRVEGRVGGTDQNPITVPIQGAIVSINADTQLIYPEQIGRNPQDIFFGVSGVEPPGPGQSLISRSAAPYIPDTQMSDALEVIGFADPSQVPPPDFRPGDCPLTLSTFTTDENGDWSFTFSPALTDYIQALRAFLIEQAEAGVAYVTAPAQVEDYFRVRISALHLDDAFGILASDNTQPGSTPKYRGIRYDFERTNAGEYKVCLESDLDCDQNGVSFNPLTQTLLTNQFGPVPPGTENEILSDILIDGLAPPTDVPGETKDDFSTYVWDGLLTFPNEKDNPSLNTQEIRIHLLWSGELYGNPDEGPDGSFLTLDNIGQFPLVLEGSNPCAPEVTYSATIPGLAVEKGPINGEVFMVVGETLWRKPIQINTIDGPTWFDDVAYEQPVAISWSPQQASITAQEKTKDVDASNSFGSTLDLGTIQNDNLEAAVVRQTFGIASQNQPTRTRDAAVTVFDNNNELPKATQKLGHINAVAEAYGMIDFLEPEKGSVQTLVDRPGNPDVGSKVPQELFFSFVPLFRYAWGVPPIAAAVLGADLIYGASFVYFAYIEATDFDISVDSLTEPSSFVTLSVFFDFSAIFGLVKASVAAGPEIAVSMPMVIIDSELDRDASGTCFQFGLELEFEVSVGPCPFCVKGSYSDTPLQESNPDDCVIAANAKRSQKAIAEAPSSDSIGIATNGLGFTFVASTDSTGVKIQEILAGQFLGTVYTLASGRGAMQPEVIFYDGNKAVAVWAQSGLSEEDFDLLVNTDYQCTSEETADGQVCTDQELFDAQQSQHMVYSLWDGLAWSQPMNLTPPMNVNSMGEGGVKLASCLSADVDCPLGGEVLAVWHRSLSADLDDNQIKLFYAYFGNGVWTAPVEIDAGANVKDVQPSPLYLMGDPAVVWVRNTDAGNTATGLQTESRRLVYQFLRRTGGTQEVFNPSPSGNFVEAGENRIASPSAGVLGTGIAITYTSSGSQDPFIGTRRALWGVRGACNIQTGICSTWLKQKQQDQHGRDIFSEKPRLMVSAGGTPMVAHRWLGTSGEIKQGDPFGVTGLGDTAMQILALPDFPGAEEQAVQVNPVTIDGLVNWQTAAIFDPLNDSAVIISAQADQIAAKAEKFGFVSQALGSVNRQKLGTDRAVTLFQATDGPDLTISSARILGSSIVNGEESADVQVIVANLGAPLQNEFSISAFIDGPPGIGSFVGTAEPVTITDPVKTEVEFAIDIPAAVNADTLRLLYVVVNDDRTIQESIGDNNQIVLALNQLLPPTNIDSFLDSSGTTAFLEWGSVEDSRVTKFRVYRRNTGESEVIQVGVTPTNGFMDMLSYPGQTYDYCVASLTDSLTESACSDWLTVEVKSNPGRLIFREDFEG